MGQETADPLHSRVFLSHLCRNAPAVCSRPRPESLSEQSGQNLLLVSNFTHLFHRMFPQTEERPDSFDLRLWGWILQRLGPKTDAPTVLNELILNCFDSSNQAKVLAFFSFSCRNVHTLQTEVKSNQRFQKDAAENLPKVCICLAESGRCLPRFLKCGVYWGSKVTLKRFLSLMNFGVAVLKRIDFLATWTPFEHVYRCSKGRALHGCIRRR